MTQYLLNIMQPDGPPPAEEILSGVMARLAALNADLQAAGAWVFTGALHAPGGSTVVRPTDRGSLITDGPYLEGKEHIGGFWIINAPDLDAALDWAAKAAAATTLPIEVRPFQSASER